MTTKEAIQPDSWLRELAQQKPAKWRWGRAIRSGICIPLPLAIGFLTGHIGIGVWMSIATLGLAPAEGNGSYRARFKLVSICALIGSVGCLAGYLGALPWGWVVVCMALIAFIASIISSFGAPYSLGALQLLVLASIALGLPQIAPFWEPSLYYLLGWLFYSAVLGVEALFLKSRPQREMMSGLVQALSALAKSRAVADMDKQPERIEVEHRRRAVTSSLQALYSEMLDRRAHKAGRTSELDAIWATLQSCDVVFAAIISAQDRGELLRASSQLDAIAAVIAQGGKRVPASVTAECGSDELSHAIKTLAAASQWSHSPFSPIVLTHRDNTGATGKMNLRIILDRLLPGHQTLYPGLVLAMCTAISYAAHWIDKDSRWYWVPLTVALIMKPDFGSVFARSLLRSLGTLAGVVIGSLALIMLPKGMELIVVMAIFSAFLPWANQRSYALLALMITPVVLVLIDLSVPSVINVNYAMQRLVGTVIGSGIVLVFAYLLLPKRHSKQFGSEFASANKAVADYLQVVVDESRSGHKTLSSAAVSKCRRSAYSRLTDVLVLQQKSLAEPPPASEEAAVWSPVIASAERICDQITAFSVKLDDGETIAADSPITELAAEIMNAPQLLPEAPARLNSAALPAVQAELVDSVRGELAFMARLTGFEKRLG